MNKPRKRKPGRCRRAVTLSRQWKPLFLNALVELGNITAAARLVGVGRVTVHQHRKDDPEFEAACRDALAQAGDLLEAEARRRAMNGVEEPVIHKGEQAGYWVNDRGQQVTHTTPGARFVGMTVTRYSDTLTMFLLRACKPKRFRENHKIDLNGKVRVRHDVDLSKLSLEQLKALEDIAQTAVATAGPAGDPGGTGSP